MRTCRPLTPGPGVQQSRAPTTRHLPDETPPPARGPPAPSSLAAQRPTSLSARRQVCGPRHVSPSEAGMPGALWAGVPPPAPTSSAAGQGPRAVPRETSRLGGGPLGLRQPSPPRQDGQSGGTPADHLPSRLQVLGVASILSLSLDCAPRAVPAQKGEYRVAPAQTPQPLRCRPVLPSLLSPHQAKGRPGAQTSEAHPAKAAQPFLHQAAWASPDPPGAPLEQGRPPGSCAAGPPPACPSLSGSSVLGHWLCQAEPPRQRQHAGGPGSEGAEPAGRAGEGPLPPCPQPVSAGQCAEG